MYRGSRLLRSLRLSTVSATVALLVVAAGMRPAPAQESTGDETAPVPVVDTISDRELENLPAEEKEREVTSMRTQGSRTFATPEGHYRTELFTHSIHHRDGEGAWQPIDDTLVSSTKASYEWENAANRYTLLLPEDLSEAPVLVEEGGHWVAMSLPGAAAAGAAAQEEATYDEALPGVSLSYAATPDAVKESIVLEGPKSPSTIEFVLKASPGLAPAKTADGGVVLLTPEGQVAFTFSPPFMVDSAEPEPAVSSDVSLEVGKKGGNLTLAVVADEKWLASPDRVWPVTIDPTTTFPTPGKDCFISSDQPNTSSCGVNRVRVGYNGTGKRRGLVVFNMGEIPRQAVVLDADFTMELVNTTTILQADYDVHRLTNTWNNSATWNRYNGDSPWATPGGDFSPGLFGTRNLGFTTGPKTWNLTELTQQWINGISVNHGMLIKQRGENVTNVLAFASDEDPSLPAPKLEVTWSHFLGEQRYYTFEEQRLNEAMHVHVNVTNGNLVLHEEDLGVAGTGLDLKVDRYFNNLSVEETRLGPGWVLGTGPEVRLIELASGHVAYHGPSGYRVRFKKGEGGNYVSPTGVDADLEKKNFGWDLEFHSKEVFHFAENGNLLRHEDKNGNDITYTYDNDRRLLDIVDTQGRQVTFQYTGARMTKMTDVAGGREYRYGYDADGRLATYTDPENATPTQFIYTTGGSLRRIIDPRGNSTLMTYDDQRRVTSITRVTNPQNDTGPRTDFIYELSDSRCPDEADTVTEVNDPRRNLTRYCHDEGAKVHEVIDAKGNSTTKKYNANSNVSEFTEAGAPAAYLFQWDTDGGDDLEGIAMPTGGQASMEYNDTEKNPHFPTEVWDFQTKDDAPATYTYDYDDNGNLKEVTASDLYDPWFSYEYNLPGKGTLKKITDGRGNETLFSYDPGGNLTEIDPPGPHGTLQFTYDAISRVRTMTDGRGRISTFTYDKLDRLVRIDYDDATFITYTYDPNGNLTRRRDAAGTWQFSYDQLNRMTAQQNPLPAEAISYTYDPAGNMETITDAGGTLTYSYDETNLMDGISDPVEGHLTFSYNKRYLRTRATYPNGLKLGFAWDDSRRLCNTAATTGTLPAPADFGCDTVVSSPMEQFRYDYQSPGELDTTLRQEVTDKAGRQTTYTYDDIARRPGRSRASSTRSSRSTAGTSATVSQS
jgi:YD repeat-containing protein